MVRIGWLLAPSILVGVVSDAPCAVWNKTTRMRHRLLTGHRGCVTSLAFFPSGDSLVTTSDDGTIRIWDARTGKEIRRFEEDGDSMFSVAVSPDGKVLAYGGLDGKIYLRTLATGKLTNQVDTESTIRCLAFSTDGKVLGSCGYQSPTCLWDTATGRNLHEFSEGFAALAFSGDGRTLATVSKLSGQGPNGSSIWAIRLRDVTTGRLLRQFGERHEYATGSDKLLWINSIAMSPDGQLLVTGGSEPQIHFWHMATGKEKTSLESPQESVDCLAFSPDGKVLASGATDGTLCLWEVSSGKLRQRFKAHRGEITSVQFAPNGQRLATGSMDSTAVVWDLKPTSSALYLSLLGFGLRVLAQTPNASIKERGDIEKFLHAKDASGNRDLFDDFIRRWGSDRLRSLKNDEDLSLSLRAAWEEIRVTIPEKSQGKTYLVDPKKLHWFVGFVEGRLNLELPSYWVNGFVGAVAYRRTNVVFLHLDESIYHATNRNLQVPRDTSVEDRDASVRLTVGEDSINIPTRQFEKILSSDLPIDRLSALMEPNRCFLLAYDGFFQHGTLFCLERPGAKTIWSKELWLGSTSGGLSGVPGFHAVSIIRQKKRLCVIGITASAAYAEACQADDGKVLFRFSTSR